MPVHRLATPEPAWIFAEVNDSAGIAHTYRIVQYPTRKGLALGLILGRIIGGPVGQLLGGLADGGLDHSIGKGEIGVALASIPDKIVELGGPDVFVRFLDGVERQDPADPERWEKVGAAATFDLVYQANYAELVAILVEVIRANFFPSSGGTGPAWWTGLLAFAERVRPGATTSTEPTRASEPSDDGQPA